MPASLAIESVGPDGALHLGETLIPANSHEIGTGEQRRVVLRNTGDTNLREITVATEGSSKEHIQLAIDEAGQPGQWTDVGGSIIAPDELAPGEKLDFWARATYEPEDSEGLIAGEFIIQAISS